MNTPSGFQVRNIVLHPGSAEGVAMATASFELTHLALFDEQATAAAAVALWEGCLLPWSLEQWFGKACAGGGQEGAAPARWLVAMSTAFQWICGDPVSSGYVVGLKGDAWVLHVAWERENSFKVSLQLALQFLQLVNDGRWNQAEQRQNYLSGMVRSLNASREGSVNFAIYNLCLEARAKGVPVRLLPAAQVRLGVGRAQLTWTSCLRVAAASQAGYSFELKQLLNTFGLPSAQGGVHQRLESAAKQASQYNWMVRLVATQPVKGECASAMVEDQAGFMNAFQTLLAASPMGVHVERRLPACLHQAFLAGGQLIGVRHFVAGRGWLDVTATVHAHNRLMLLRAAKSAKHDPFVVEFCIPDVTVPFNAFVDHGWFFTEVFMTAWIPTHWFEGVDRGICGPLLEQLFGEGKGRIPVCAVTGSVGKTTTTRMLHHILCAGGATSALACSSGIYVGAEMVSDKNASSFPGAVAAMACSEAESAALEVTRAGIIRLGHAVDFYDVGVLLNIGDEHIGQDGMDSKAHMAQLKASILKRSLKAVVVNAEDPLCLSVLAQAGANRQVLVAPTNAGNAAFSAHVQAGGEGLYVGQHSGAPWFMLAKGTQRSALVSVAAIPATVGGVIRHNVTNALFATATAVALGVSVEKIREGLASFDNSFECNPGRYNQVHGLPFEVLLDSAHAPQSVAEICRMARELPVTGKRRIACLELGNQERSSAQLSAPALAEAFDDFILGQYPPYVVENPEYASADPRGRMLELFAEDLIQAGANPATILCERDREKCIRLALSRAQPGDLLVILSGPNIAMKAIEGFRKQL